MKIIFYLILSLFSSHATIANEAISLIDDIAFTELKRVGMVEGKGILHRRAVKNLCLRYTQLFESKYFYIQCEIVEKTNTRSKKVWEDVSEPFVIGYKEFRKCFRRGTCIYKKKPLVIYRTVKRKRIDPYQERSYGLIVRGAGDITNSEWYVLTSAAQIQRQSKYPFIHTYRREVDARIACELFLNQNIDRWLIYFRSKCETPSVQGGFTFVIETLNPFINKSSLGQANWQEPLRQKPENKNETSNRKSTVFE